MIYVYAVVDDPSVNLDDLCGIDGTALALVVAGRIAAVVSVHQRLCWSSEATDLWTHERVSSGLLERCAVAPVRFGTVVRDLGNVAAALAADEQRFVALLGQLSGTVELAVRADCSAPPQSHPDHEDAPLGAVVGAEETGPGRRHLRSLHAGERERSELRLGAALTAVHDDLRKRAKRSLVSTNPAGGMVAAYLVSAPAVGEFRDAVRAIAERSPEIRLSLTGPWAPFSFVDTGARASA